MKALVVAVLLASSLAHADAISDEQAACLKHAAGDDCGTSGTCVTEKCTHQLPGRPATSWDCLACRPGRSSSGSASLIAGIAVAVVLIGGGVAFAYTRRHKEGA